MTPGSAARYLSEEAAHCRGVVAGAEALQASIIACSPVNVNSLPLPLRLGRIGRWYPRQDSNLRPAV